MLNGSIVALVTPMKEDQSLDLEALTQLIEWHIEQGTQGLVLLGSTGESCTIDFDERKKLIQHAVQINRSRLPMIVGSGSYSTRFAIELTQQACDLGADACLVVTPYYNRPNQEGLYEHFKALAETVSIPQLLYNVPVRTGCDLLPKTVAQLSAIPNIIGIKDATGNLNRLSALKDYCSGFDLLSGDDATCADFVLSGGHGVISVAANILPKKMRYLMEAAEAGDKQKVQEIESKLIPLYKALAVESNPIPVKWGLHYMNKIASGMRLPLTTLSSDRQTNLRNFLDHLKEES